MSDKNIRVKVLKEEVINEVSLTDLLDLASKAQTAVMQLTDNCMKFNDDMLRQLSAKVNKDVSDLGDTIRQAIINNQKKGVSTTTGPAAPTADASMGGGTEDGMSNERTALETPTLGDRNFTESELVTEGKKLYQKLKEAFGQEEDEAADEEETTDETPTDQSVSEPAVDSSKTIDLSAPFTEIISGLSEEQFVNFKTSVVNALKASGITSPEFQTIVSEIENTVQVDDFNFAFDSLYDFADANNITISTEKPQTEAPVEDTNLPTDQPA